MKNNMEIKLDKSTLPADGQYVRFQTTDEVWRNGYFVEKENLFSIDDDEFVYAFDVLQWKPITPNTNNQ